MRHQRAYYCMNFNNPQIQNVMKKSLKVVCSIGLIALIGTVGFTQETNNNIEIGTVTLDPYVGLPVGGFDQDFSLEYYGSVSGSEPLGLPVSFGTRLDYIANETLGIGLDVNYASYGYSITDTSIHNKFDEVEVIKYRIMLRFNKYFILRPDLCAYYGFGMGYRGGYRVESAGSDRLKRIFFPLDGRLALGVRYYFGKHVGIHAETGIGGGGVMQFGISCRF